MPYFNSELYTGWARIPDQNDKDNGLSHKDIAIIE
jgi:hypothetical protein